ncbi:YihY/virulence factor BrkB family protein [Xanthovirga aplysinae]|uniref:YihY/virulence factor BrkB family protein n=1 Tax=Xanthovirga aplysinae TaxID=2529853 RepID=UPI0012BB7013|nr:YihY/virulence factor BrkB family protein [Xanthovirga aplysinae]MTI33502.1 YihY/virulence factor BrkB family protein [Xanthovirga aplysinae]
MIRKFVKIVNRATSDFIEEGAMALAAGIAYYAIFSFPAILIIVLKVAGIVYGQKAVAGELFTQISELVGSENAHFIEQVVQGAYLSDFGPVALSVGLTILFFSATTVFKAVQSALNLIWMIQVKPKGIKSYIKVVMDRLFAFLVILIFGLVLIAFLLAGAIIDHFQQWISQYFSLPSATIIHQIHSAISFFTLVLMVGVTFKILPDVRLKWKDVWFGAITTALLLSLGRYLIGVYLEHSNVSSSYGAAGSVVVMLLWIYYSSCIYLFGAQLTEAYVEISGGEIKAGKNAVKIRIVEASKVDEDLKEGIDFLN